jgi:hypothetical protein
MTGIDEKENEARMGRGELYFAFLPELTAKRIRGTLERVGFLKHLSTSHELRWDAGFSAHVKLSQFDRH